jgi:hypothetical protein
MSETVRGDGCTGFFDGSWRHCCDAHDRAYELGTLTWRTHLELGQCVSQSEGGILIGLAMFLATLLWWLVKHRRP